MRAAKLIESLLRSPVPNWDSVELGDISRTIERKKRQYSGLRSIRNKPGVAQELRSIIEDVGKLYSGRAHKWASHSLADLNKEISRVETRLKERENSFDSLYLNALKSQRSEQPVILTPKRHSFKPKKSRPAGPPSPIANPFATVMQLSTALSIEFCPDHTHFVKAPIRPGLQPCLIELQQVGGSVKLVDALTVLPCSVVSHPVTDPIYAAYLDLITREYAADIQRLSGDKKMRRLSAKTPEDPPFRCAASSATRQKVFEALENSKLLGERGLKGSVTDLVHEATKSAPWHPQHVEVGRTAKKWLKVWAVLARWDEWELQKPPRWTDRLHQHYSDVKLSIDSKVVSRQKEALRKMCDTLHKLVGLRKGDLSQLRRLEQGALPKRTIIL